MVVVVVEAVLVVVGVDGGGGGGGDGGSWPIIFVSGLVDLRQHRSALDKARTRRFTTAYCRLEGTVTTSQLCIERRPSPKRLV